ncbi:dTDP-glucose 4,6-dehydratase [Streptomyces sp. MST-110588]|uniref:dTDP-glucose 4,6-dehydratase n=1 Tax=Streptomyces sp. MST-110588 TaxID=2833628 RepID=UPI001F5CD17D|nr:dTDP-glucose 4,6-dehydratase [Streptomyces sp. MST-110588]UNO40789.1 dTDP-glucose 4,6-dehydratase [Streptomyces sp. MST-110588]
MKLLVTGGAGFIGSHYVRTLLEDGYPGWEGAHVTVLDALTYAGNRANLPASHPRLEFVHGDIRDRALLAELLPGHDAVVHFAAESHVDRSVCGGPEFVETNVVGTHALLEAVRQAKVERIVCVSTDEVYGTIDEGSWTEDFPLLPNSPYAAAKAGSDLIARAYWRTHGLDVVITRCCNNYGPYQHTEKLIPRFVTTLLSGGRVPLYGDGGNVREWLHVEDHCRAVHSALAHGRSGEIYNIGSTEELTNLELTRRLLELCGADERSVERVADRPGHDRRYSLDAGKIRTELGWQPRVSLEQGLADTVDWYRKETWWWQRPTNRD